VAKLPDIAERRPQAGSGASVKTSPAATIADPADIADLLAESDRRDRELALRHAYFRWGWAAALTALASEIGGRIQPTRPTELELLRYGPGGRAHHADPRPGDYPGQGGDAA
jgi:hypothetical protein